MEAPSGTAYPASVDPRGIRATVTAVMAIALLVVAGFTSTWLGQLGPFELYLRGAAPPGQAAYMASRWAGLFALVLIWVQLILGITLRGSPGSEREDREELARLHQRLGIVALLAALSHPAFFLAGIFQRTGEVRLDLLSPLFGKGFYEASIAVGTLGLYLLLLGSTAALLRGLSLLEGVWRRLHWFNIPVFLVATFHAVLIGSDTRMVGVVLLILLGVVSAIVLFGTTERRRAEQRLLLFKNIVDNSQEGIALYDPSGRPLYLNPACRELLARSPDPEGLGARLAESVREGRRREGILEGGGALKLWLRSDGVRDEGGGLLYSFGIMHDVSARLQAEEEVRRARDELEVRVREATSRLQVAREEERGRIARELHDQLGQYLTVLALDLSWLEEHLGAAPGSEALRERVESMEELVESTLQTVRRMARELLPRHLEDLGLAAAVEAEARQVCQRAGLSLRFGADLKGVKPEKACAIALFRICQEALTNAVRHARARQVEIELAVQEGDLWLRIRDDGMGITPEQATGRHSRGLAGIRERATPWEGRVEIAGRPGEGTVVSVRIPVERAVRPVQDRPWR